MDIPVYDFSIDNTTDGHGVSVVSLVDFPAIQVDFIALSEDKRFQFKASPDQQMLYGPLLVPGQMIYRNDEMGEYYMRFSAETIALIAQKFQKDNNSNSITVDHSGVKVDATISELWITGNPDKSQQFGFNLPVGTWFAGVHVTDQAFWTDEVKTGNVKGFSVEVAGALNKAKLLMEELIIKPNTGENENDFLGRCIGISINEGKDASQAAAICHSIWDNKMKTSLMADRVSFDWDGTASTAAGKAKLDEAIKAGYDVYVITARASASGIDIPLRADHIIATGSNEAKIAKVKELGIKTHYDNNPDVVKALGNIGKLFQSASSQLAELAVKMNEIIKLMTETKIELAASGMEAGKLADGTVVMTDTGKMVAGEHAYDDKGNAMIDGDYELTDGTQFTVVTGIIDSVELPSVDAVPPVANPAGAPAAQGAETAVEEAAAAPNKMEEALSMMESKIQDILNRVSILEASMSMSADKIEALSIAPGAKSIKGRKEDKTIDNKKADFAEMVTKIQGITKQVNSKRIW